MKVILIRTEKKTVGWKIEAETTEDKLILGSMRNLQFFGMGKNKVSYGGMTLDPEDTDYVMSMEYTTEGYQQEQNDTMLNRLRAEESAKEDFNGMCHETQQE